MRNCIEICLQFSKSCQNIVLWETALKFVYSSASPGKILCCKRNCITMRLQFSKSCQNIVLWATALRFGCYSASHVKILSYEKLHCNLSAVQQVQSKYCLMRICIAICLQFNKSCQNNVLWESALQFVYSSTSPVKIMSYENLHCNLYTVQQVLSKYCLMKNCIGICLQFSKSCQNNFLWKTAMQFVFSSASPVKILSCTLIP
jgi:hypothetical protein